MSHDDQDRPNLKLLAQQAPGFLAEPLFTYQVTHQLTNEQLAAEIGVPIEQLENLALYTIPTASGNMATLADYVQPYGFLVFLFTLFPENQRENTSDNEKQVRNDARANDRLERG